MVGWYGHVEPWESQQEQSVFTRMGLQWPRYLLDGIWLGAESVSSGDTGKSLEMLEGGNRRVPPSSSKEIKLPAPGRQAERQAGQLR